MHASRAAASLVSLAALVAALATIASGCTRRPSGGAQPADRSEEAASSSAYDPAEDPLVNPKALFEPAGPGDRVADDETLVRYLKVEPTSLNPLFYRSVYDSYFVALLFDSVVRIDSRLGWQLNESLVESSEVSDDHSRWTLRLRPDAKFHDGAPLTAHDVQFSWEATVADEVRATVWKSRSQQLERVHALDDRTVEFVHRDVTATSRWNMAFPILPRHILDAEDERAADPTLASSDYYKRYARAPIGSGAYRLVEWVDNERVVLERWDGFLGERPSIRRVIFRVVTDADQALNLFKAGELDELELTPLQFATQTDDEAFAKVGVKLHAPQWSFYFVYWNLSPERGLFDDPRTRRALAHAVDIPGLIEKVCHNLFPQATGIFHADAWFAARDVAPIPHDPATAGRLLDESGWILDPSTGRRFREVDGERHAFEFTILIPGAGALSADVAAVMQQDLAKLGVGMELRTVDFSVLVERRSSGDFDACMLGLSTGVDPDLSRSSWRSGEPRNYNGYSNPEVDALFDRAQAVFDESERAELYRRVHRLIYEDQPCLFLWNVATLHALHKRIRGVQVSPRGVFGFHPSMLAWWVPADEKRR